MTIKGNILASVGSGPSKTNTRPLESRGDFGHDWGMDQISARLDPRKFRDPATTADAWATTISARAMTIRWAAGV